MEEANDNIKKNLLDLEYSKHLQYFNTSILVLVTYVIGLILAFATKQVDFSNPSQLMAIGIISSIVSLICVLSMINSRNHIKNIPEKIKRLSI